MALSCSPGEGKNGQLCSSPMGAVALEILTSAALGTVPALASEEGDPAASAPPPVCQLTKGQAALPSPADRCIWRAGLGSGSGLPGAAGRAGCRQPVWQGGG